VISSTTPIRTGFSATVTVGIDSFNDLAIGCDICNRPALHVLDGRAERMKQNVQLASAESGVIKASFNSTNGY
jgi:hypothetical protein